MTSNFRAAANTSGFIAPGAIFRFINSGGAVNFNGEFRVVSFIGTASTQLPKIAEPVTRSLIVDTADQLSEATALSVSAVGQFAGINSFLQHRPGALLAPGAEGSDFSDKITVEFLQANAVTEDYIVTVERIGGPGNIADSNTGAYSITTVSTGETSVWYAVDDQYANTAAIPGVNLKVTTTIGEQLGNTAKVKVVVDPTEGDFLFDSDNGGMIDWSPNLGSEPFGQKIGIPIQVSTSSAFDIIELSKYDSATLGNLATGANTLVQPDFVADGLDNAKYKVYGLNTTQFSIDKVKDGITEVAIGGFLQDGSSSAPVTAFTNGQPYIVDGFVINLDNFDATCAMEFTTYGSTSRVLTQKKDGMKGLEDLITLFPVAGKSTLSDTFVLRVFKSDNASTGVSSGSFTIFSETTEITSAPINAKLSQNLSAMSGCSLIIPTTRIKGADLTGWNLILNSSIEGGSLTAPHNWALGSLAKVVELDSSTLIHGSRTLKLPAGIGVGDGPTVNTFKFENANSTRPFKLSWYAKSTDGTSAGSGTGVQARVQFFGASGTLVATGGTVSSDVHTFSGSLERHVTASLDIPAGAIVAKVTFFNDSAVDAYVDAIQMEQTDLSGDVLDYHESDVVVVRTTEHRVPSEPLPVISAYAAFPEDKSRMLQLIKLEAIRGTRRVSSDWVVRKLDTATYQVTRTTTGDVFGPLSVDVRYTNVIPGAAITVKSQTDDASVNWNEFATNSIALVNTLSGINVTGSIPNPNYFVSYNFARPTDEFYTVKQYLQAPEIVSDLGDATIDNSLVLASLIAMENGANIIQTVQLDSDVNWDAAFEALSKVYSNVVVPLLTVDVVDGGDGSGTPTDAQYERATQINFQALNHATLMSMPLQKKERIIITSQLPNRDITLYSAEALAANNERMVMVAPTSVVKDVRSTTTGNLTSTTIPGCYLAAAVAGLATRYDVAEPWLRKPLFGFRGLGQALTDAEVNFLGASGITVVGTRRTANPLDSRVAAANVAGQNGALVISIASTTCTSGTVDQVEPSIVQIKDYVGRTVRNLLDDVYIGQKNIQENRANIEGTTKNILTGLVNSQIITDFNNLVVSNDPVEPRAVNVTFEIAPVYPINYILVEFSLIQTPSPNSNLIR